MEAGMGIPGGLSEAGCLRHFEERNRRRPGRRPGGTFAGRRPALPWRGRNYGGPVTETVTPRWGLVLGAVLADFLEEGFPGAAGFAVIEEEVGAVFLSHVFAVVVADAFPVVVGDDAAEGDVVFRHEGGGEPGGLVDRAGAAVVAVLAHFDADRVAIARAFVVGVLALHVVGEGLVNGVVVDGVVPGDIAEGVVGAFEGAVEEELGVGAGAGSKVGVLGGVDGDVAGAHRAGAFAAVGNVGLGDAGGGEARPGGGGEGCVELPVGGAAAAEEEKGDEEELADHGRGRDMRFTLHSEPVRGPFRVPFSR